MKRIIFLAMAFLSQPTFALGKISIEGSPEGFDIDSVFGCVFNVHTQQDICVRSLTRYDKNLDESVTTGVFKLFVAPGGYVPYLKTIYGAKSSFTYSGNSIFSSSPIFIRDLEQNRSIISASPSVVVSSVCDNLNSTVTIKGAGFGDIRGSVFTSGFRSSSSSLPVWTKNYIVFVKNNDFPLFPLTVFSKTGGASVVFSGNNASIPVCN